MVATLGDLDVGSVSRRCQDARRGLVVEIVGEVGNGAIPGIARKSPVLAPVVTFRPRSQDGERACVARSLGNACRSQNLLQFARADDRIHLRNILSNLVAKAFHQTAGDDQFSGLPVHLVFRHFQDGVHRLLLCAADERACVDHDHVGIFCGMRQLGTSLSQHAHHDLAIHEVLGATQADEANLGGSVPLRGRGNVFFLGHLEVVQHLQEYHYLNIWGLRGR